MWRCSPKRHQHTGYRSAGNTAVPWASCDLPAPERLYTVLVNNDKKRHNGAGEHTESNHQNDPARWKKKLNGLQFLSRKTLAEGNDPSIKPGARLRWTQHCWPRPWTHLSCEMNRVLVPQVLLRHIRDKWKDILLLTVDSKQLDTVYPDESAGQNDKSVFIKVSIFIFMEDKFTVD